MKAIKGLITKDLLQLKSYRKTLIIFLIIFTLVSIEQESTNKIGSMLAVMMTLGFGMFSIATFSYDELSKAERYILTLPVTKKEVVLARYILVITSTLLGCFVGLILSIFVSLVMNHQLPNIENLLSIGLGGIFGIGVVEAIQIPCIYKFGAEKGKIQMFIITAIVAFLFGGIAFIGEKMNISIAGTLDWISNILPILFGVMTLFVYCVSYKISYGIYKKKEF